MTTLIAGTHAVQMDEACFGLYEQNLQSPGSRGWRRYQVILVVRNDKVAEMRRDLGPAKAFTAPQFRIPGGVRDETTGRIEILHTVGELHDIAEHLRDGRVAEPEIERTDFLAAYHDERDQRRRARRRLSQFGRLHKTQRSS